VILLHTDARDSRNHNIGRIDRLSYWFYRDPLLLGQNLFNFGAFRVSCAIADGAVGSQLVAKSNAHTSSANDANLHFAKLID